MVLTSRAAVLAAVLSATGACHAAPLIESDFARDSQGWVLNGSSALRQLAELGAVQVLQLTSGQTSQVGTVWTHLRRRVPSFSFIADVRVRFTPQFLGDCPADAFTLVFAPVEPDAMGGAGSSIGLCESPLIRQFAAVEVNTWSGQGLGSPEEKSHCSYGKNETLAFDVIIGGQTIREALRFQGRGTPDSGGFKIGQTLPPAGMRVVNGGWFRYQWNAGPDGTLSLYVTGLQASNRHIQKIKALEVKMTRNPLDFFDGRWGLTAATGGAAQTVEVARVRIDSPMVEPL